jgi:hypothetical protein
MTSLSDSITPTTCRRCGSTELVVTQCTSGPNPHLIRCTSCRATWFPPAPWTIERARAFTMGYGKHRGRKLGDLMTSEDGRDYLRWLTDTDHGNATIAARILLDSSQSTCDDLTNAAQAKAPGCETPGASVNRSGSEPGRGVRRRPLQRKGRHHEK